MSVSEKKGRITSRMFVLFNKIKYLPVLFVFASIFFLVPDVSADTYELNNQEWKLSEEQWDLVKQGEQLLKMPVMQQVIDGWSKQQDHGIELRYPGGEEGELWVEELKDWLISLAIPSQYLYVVPGSGEADVIIIKLFKVGDV